MTRPEQFHSIKLEPCDPKESIGEIELRLDGEERFRAAVRAAAKSGPMHRPAKR